MALPDAFFATDGLFETFLTVLDDFGAYPAVIDRELERYLPFLATTKVLMAAVRAGVGRETAHEAIKEHAVAVALAHAGAGHEGNDLLDRLAADPRLPLDRRRRSTRSSAIRSTFVGDRRRAGRSPSSTRSAAVGGAASGRRRATGPRPSCERTTVEQR